MKPLVELGGVTVQPHCWGIYPMIQTLQPLLGGVSLAGLKPPYGGHISARGGAEGMVDGMFLSYLLT